MSINWWKWKVWKWWLLICVQLFAMLWTAGQVPRSMGFFRQEYWSRLPFPSQGDLPNPGTEPQSLALQADSLLSEPLNVIGNPNVTYPYNRILFGSRKWLKYWLTLQGGWTSKTSHQMKKVSHRKKYILYCPHFREISRIHKSVKGSLVA